MSDTPRAHFDALVRTITQAIAGRPLDAALRTWLSETHGPASDWFRDLQPWVDFNFAQTRLFDSTMTGEYWAQLGVSSLIWLVLPRIFSIAPIYSSWANIGRKCIPT